MNKTACVALGIVILPAAATAANLPKHRYPTLERVEYVVDCMHRHGGETYDTLYKCSCSIDYIANQVSYRQYITYDTYTRGQHAAGERPEVLREGKLAHQGRAKLAKLKSQAADQCLLKKPTGDQNKNGGQNNAGNKNKTSNG